MQVHIIIPIPLLFGLEKLDNCDNCGKCCYTVKTPPFGKSEPIPSHLPLTIGEKHCSWYDPENKRCLHYEDRPAICKEFPINSIPCQVARFFNKDC